MPKLRLLNFLNPAHPTIFTPESRAFMEERFQVVLFDRSATGPADLWRQIEEADPQIILTGWSGADVRITDDALNAAGNLQVWAHLGSTLAKVFDAPEHFGRLPILNAAIIIGRYVAESTLGHMIYGLRRIRDLNAVCLAEGTWGHREDPGFERSLRHARVGLVGLGSVGREVLKLLKPFGSTVRAADPAISPQQAAELGVELLPLDQLLATSDVVSLHAPAIPATHHLIDAAALKKMRDGTLLINTARGLLIDSEALAGEIASGRLWAICDTLEQEGKRPLKDDPLHQLGGRPNFLLTPHIAGMVPSARGHMLCELLGEAQEVAIHGRSSPLRASKDALTMG